MKRLNKKGFTLAELLIVIAIIAILIAIAIPAFGSALDNARIQTDHANMRNAYAIAQVANLQGFIEVDGTETKLADFTGPAYFGADGSVVGSANKAKAYVTAVTPKGDGSQCTSSAFCTSGGPDTSVPGNIKITGQPITHTKNQVITFSLNSGSITLSLTAAS